MTTGKMAGRRVGALCGLLCVLLSFPSLASTYRDIHLFGGSESKNGNNPQGGVIADSASRLYGVTANGGDINGTVYRLTPPSTPTGPWLYELLHVFNLLDGSFPTGRLLLGPKGELYGTTSGGGGLNGGTVYRLDNTPGWPLTTLHLFKRPPTDGGRRQTLSLAFPEGSLVFGPGGLLYGTASSIRRTGNSGGVFSVSPLGDTVEYAVIHPFDCAPGPKGGCGAPSGLIATPDGSLYGVTPSGGLTATSAGVLFRLRLSHEGNWTYSIVYDFPGNGSIGTPTVLARDKQGVFYGCGAVGASPSVFNLTSQGDPAQTYKETTLYSYTPVAGDLAYCAGAVTPETDGSILATIAYRNATYQQNGQIVQLTPPSVGSTRWTTAIVHRFGGMKGNAFPDGALLALQGLFYGIKKGVQSVLPSATIFKFRP